MIKKNHHKSIFASLMLGAEWTKRPIASKDAKIRNVHLIVITLNENIFFYFNHYIIGILTKLYAVKKTLKDEDRKIAYRLIYIFPKKHFCDN